MIKVADVVLNLVQGDDVAFESLRSGQLNLSAYANKIHKQVENATFKEVRKGTVVVALSRIAKRLPKVDPLYPEVKLKGLSFKSSLCVLSFNKTLDLQRKISVLNPFQISTNDLIAVTEGISEISMVVTEVARDKIIKDFGVKPKSIEPDLVAVTAQFPDNYLKIPNVIYTLLSSLAVKRINIVELISTFTEITFIVEKDRLEDTVGALNLYFSNKN